MNVLHSMDLSLTTTPSIFVDNMELIHFIVKNGSTKDLVHIPLQFHTLKQLIREAYDLHHISGRDNPANILTKSVPRAEIQTFFSTYDDSCSAGK